MMAEPVTESKEDKENVSHQCNLCKLSYTIEQDLREHFWSLMHHMKIEEKKKNSLHNCTLCYATCSTIAEYRKHLSGEKHQKAIEKYSEDCKKAKEEKEKESRNIPVIQPFGDTDQDLPDNDNSVHYDNQDETWHDQHDGFHGYPYNQRNMQNPTFHQRSFPQPDYRRHYNKQWSKQGPFANRRDYEEQEYYEQQREFSPYHYSGFRQRYNRDPPERPPRDFGRRHFEHHDDEYYKDFNPRDSYKRGSSQFSNDRRDFNKYSQNGQIERPPRDFAKSDQWGQPFQQNFGHPEYNEYPNFDNPHWHGAQWDREPPLFYTMEEEMNYHDRGRRENSGQRMSDHHDEEYNSNAQDQADDSKSRPKSFQNSEMNEGSEKNESREGSPSVSSSNQEPLEHSNGRKRVREGEGESSASKASRKAEFISELRKRHASPTNSPSRDFLKNSTDDNPFVELAHASLGYTEQPLETMPSSDRSVTSSRDSAVKRVNSPLQRRRNATIVTQRYVSGKGSPKNVRGSKFSPGKKSNKIIETESSGNVEKNSSQNGVLETAEKLCRDLREKRQKVQMEKEKSQRRQKQKTLNSQIASLSEMNRSYLKGHLSQNKNLSSPSVVPETRPVLESSHSQSSEVNNDFEQASHSSDPRFSSLPVPQRTAIEKIRHEIESSVRVTKRFVRSSSEITSQREKNLEASQHHNISSRPSGKGKGPMSKDSLAKMVNAPRSRKERLQLAQIVRSHNKTQNKLAPSRLNVQLSGLYDNENFDFDEEMSEITLEDLSPQVKMQIAQLIEDDIVDFDTDFVSSPKTPLKKRTANRGNVDQLMDVDGDFMQRTAKEEPTADNTELSLADLVAPLVSDGTGAESELNVQDLENHPDDSTIDSGNVTDDRVWNRTSNPNTESSRTDQSLDDTVMQSVSSPEMHVSTSPGMSLSHGRSPNMIELSESHIRTSNLEISESHSRSLNRPTVSSETSLQHQDSVLSSILCLSQKEEEKQAELESVHMRVGRLHNWLQQILNHLSNFEQRQTKLQEEIRGFREERIQLLNSALNSGNSSAVPSTVVTSDKEFSSSVSVAAVVPIAPVAAVAPVVPIVPVESSTSTTNMLSNSLLETVSSSIPSCSLLQSTAHTPVHSIQFSTAPSSSHCAVEHLVQPTNMLGTTSQTSTMRSPNHSFSRHSVHDTISETMLSGSLNPAIRRHSTHDVNSPSSSGSLNHTTPRHTNSQSMSNFTQGHAVHDTNSQSMSSSSPRNTVHDTNNQTPTRFSNHTIQQQSAHDNNSRSFSESIRTHSVFSKPSRTSATVSFVTPIQPQRVLGSTTSTPIAALSDLCGPDNNVLTTTKQRSDSIPGASDSSTDRMYTAKTSLDGVPHIKEERVTPPLYETVSSSYLEPAKQMCTVESSVLIAGHDQTVTEVDSLTTKIHCVSKESSYKTKDFLDSPGRQILLASARQLRGTISESGNSESGLMTSHKISESDHAPSSQSQDEGSVDKGTAMPVQYLGTIRGDLDSTDILQKVAANLGGLNNVHGVSYLYLNQNESVDIQTLMSTVCMDSSANNAASSSELQLMELDTDMLNDKSTRQVTSREESDLGSIASSSSLGEKIQRLCQVDVPRTTLDTVEASLSDGDRTLQGDECGHCEACSQNSDNTPGKILKQCSVVLEKLELTKQNAEENALLMETETVSSLIRKKRKTKKERDLLAKRKHKYWIDLSSSENSSQDEDKEEGMSSLKQQLVFQSKSEEDNNSEESQNTKAKESKDSQLIEESHIDCDGGASQIQTDMVDSVSSVKEKTDCESLKENLDEDNPDADPKVDLKRLKQRQDNAERFCLVMSQADDVSTDKMSYVGALTPVSCLQVFQNELYVSYQGMENVRRFDLSNGKCITAYNCTLSEHLIVSKSTAENNPIKLFVSGSSETLQVFDVRESKPLDVVPLRSAVQCMHSFGSLIYLGLVSGEVHVIKKRNNRVKDIFTCADKPIHSITSTKEAGRMLLCVGAQDATISICDALSGLPIRILDGHTKTAFSIKASLDQVFSGSGDKTVMVHNLHTGELEWTYHDHRGIVTSVWIYEDILFSAGFDGFVRCFDIKKQTLKQRYYGAGKSAITCMAVYDNKLYTGNRKGEVECVSLNLDKNWSCRSPGCTYVFGLREHLLHHIISDHTIPNTNMMRCPWKDCPCWISTENDIKVVEEHLKKHIDDTVLVIGESPNLATVIPMTYKE